MSPLITTVVSGLFNLGKSAFERRERIKSAKEEATIESIKARQKNVGYMDDFLLFLHAGPVIGVFFPLTREQTLEGIEALHSLPEWYLVIWFTMIAAVWGAPKLADLRVNKG